MRRPWCAAATVRRNGKTIIRAGEAQVARPERAVGRDAAQRLVDEENIDRMLKDLEIDDFAPSSEEAEHRSAMLSEHKERR